MKSEKEIKEVLKRNDCEIATELKIGAARKYPSGVFKGFSPRNGQESTAMKKALKWALE